jgi:hypothetical protein
MGKNFNVAEFLILRIDFFNEVNLNLLVVSPPFQRLKNVSNMKPMPLKVSLNAFRVFLNRF